MNAIAGKQTFETPRRINSGFHIGQADRLTIQGKRFDWAGQSGSTIFLQPSDGQKLTEQFSMEMLSRLSAAGGMCK